MNREEMVTTLRQKGLSMRAIAEEMNKTGVKTGAGKRFDQSAVYYILNKKKKSTSTKVNPITKTTTTIVDAIRSVNNCQDIGPATKQTVISILLAGRH